MAAVRHATWCFMGPGRPRVSFLPGQTLRSIISRTHTMRMESHRACLYEFHVSNTFTPTARAYGVLHYKPAIVHTVVASTTLWVVNQKGFRHAIVVTLTCWSLLAMKLSLLTFKRLDVLLENSLLQSTERFSCQVSQPPALALEVTTLRLPSRRAAPLVELGSRRPHHPM